MSLPTQQQLNDLEALIDSEWNKILSTGKLPRRTSPDHFSGHEQWSVRGGDGREYTFVLYATASDPLPDGSAGMNLEITLSGGLLRGAAAARGGPDGMDLVIRRERKMPRRELP